ncbi:hypothetical protein Droror1_Dr00004669 [Drosera rotundifolia]
MGSISFLVPGPFMLRIAAAGSNSVASCSPQLSRRSRCGIRRDGWMGLSNGRVGVRRSESVAASRTLMRNSLHKSGVYIVSDFMTRKENLQVVKPSTSVDEALEALVDNRITGFPVVDDDWKLVGVVSDYDLLALDSISGSARSDNSMFPEVDSTWKVFNEIQKLLSKTNGQVIADVMTLAPLVVRETTNLEDAARLLLETRYRRLPVVDADGKLVGIITRGDVVRAALQIQRSTAGAEP